MEQYGDKEYRAERDELAKQYAEHTERKRLENKAKAEERERLEAEIERQREENRERREEEDRKAKESKESIRKAVENYRNSQYLKELSESPDSIFEVMTANDTIRLSSTTPDPTSLYARIWYEGEICCLFADSNVGKSILAVQIATMVAMTGRNVLYFDFELSNKQFQMRYTDQDSGKPYTFPDNLYRVSINPVGLANRGESLESVVINEMDRLAMDTESNILIIDNLTYLCLESEKGDAAGAMMMKLMELKHRSNLSILILAHTPKRPMDRGITQNDLAGSKKLFNFFDSVFAIGKSNKDESIRYLKQIKVRFGEFLYDADNVALFEIGIKEGLLSFVHQGSGREEEFLQVRTTEEYNADTQKIREMLGEGKSYRAIAAELHLSKCRVEKVANSLKS